MVYYFQDLRLVAFGRLHVLGLGAVFVLGNTDQLAR